MSLQVGVLFQVYATEDPDPGYLTSQREKKMQVSDSSKVNYRYLKKEELID